MTDRLEAAIRELVAALSDELIAGHPPASAPDRLLSVDEAAAALGIGRTTMYGELQAGRVRSVNVGRRRLVPSSAIAERVA
jgi:excisionase family DNA binding protein